MPADHFPVKTREKMIDISGGGEGWGLYWCIDQDQVCAGGGTYQAGSVPASLDLSVWWNTLTH